MTADWELFGTEVLRIVVALVLGGSIGLERELRERAAGFRTHILVAMGASAFTLASIYGFQLTAEQAAGGQTYDPSRVAAQIVSGIGFLGAGAIIRHGMSVRGLTTAQRLAAGRGQGRMDLHVRFAREKYGNLSRLIGILDERHVTVLRLNSDLEDADRRVVHLSLQLPANVSRNELMSIISRDSDTVEVSAD
ncbi:MAG TPA: MgtC/SapB family protein [Thermoleophilia bacterium]|nr:MgtC/SapB family protein [Thermoleophilia bacterium]